MAIGDILSARWGWVIVEGIVLAACGYLLWRDHRKRKHPAPSERATDAEHR
jgi:hypothetical protein